MVDNKTNAKDHLAGRALSSDESTNSFIIIVYEIYFQVQSEFSVQSKTKTFSYRQPL